MTQPDMTKSAELQISASAESGPGNDAALPMITILRPGFLAVTTSSEGMRTPSLFCGQHSHLLVIKLAFLQRHYLSLSIHHTCVLDSGLFHLTSTCVLIYDMKNTITIVFSNPAVVHVSTCVQSSHVLHFQPLTSTVFPAFKSEYLFPEDTFSACTLSTTNEPCLSASCNPYAKAGVSDGRAAAVILALLSRWTVHFIASMSTSSLRESSKTHE